MTAPTPPVAYRCCEHCGINADPQHYEERDDHDVPCAIPDAEDCPGRQPTS